MESQDLTEAGAKSIRDEGYVGLLEKKWDRLLSGIRDPYIRKTTAMLFENQQGDMRRRLTEETLSTNAGEYTKYIFPLLRRVFPNLIANEVISVQPMSAPVGAIFYWEYKHGKSKGATTKGTNLIESFDSDYTSEKVAGETTALPNGVDYGGVGAVLTALLQFTPVRPLNASTGVSVTLQDVDADGTVVQEATDNGAGAFTGDTTAGTLNYVTGQITGFLFTAAPGAGAGRKILSTYWYDSEANNQVPNVTMDIAMSEIRARTRKVKGDWSAEASDDLRSFHGVDAEAELVSGISQEVGLEIDREILGQLLAAATLSTATFDFTVPAGLSEVDHISAVMTRISAVSFQIQKKSKRSPANWIVTSPEVSAKLVQLQRHGDLRPMWVSDPGSTIGPYDGTVVPPSYGPVSSHAGIMKLGMLSNKWLAYQDPLFRSNKILVGLRGNSYLDAGYVFSPYVPFQMTPTFFDPDDQVYKKGFRTRYATKLLRPEWYGTVTITGGL